MAGSGAVARLVAAAVLAAALGCGPAAAPASGKGIENMSAPAGVVVRGLSYRYVAIPASKGLRSGPDRGAGAMTVVERIDRAGGRVARWWKLGGDWFVPAVAYDGSGGGLSADGRTLVLQRFSDLALWRRDAAPGERYRTDFAVLDTALHLRHPQRPGTHRPEHAVAYFSLDGDYAFDAISPDGGTVYLIHYLHPGALSPYEVRALDLRTGRLLPEPIVDRREPEERMEGLPIARAASPDGRWAYTLYDGNGKTPFVHALDTVRGRAFCVDVPQLKGMVGELSLLRLRSERGGRRLAVIGRPSGWGQRHDLLLIDTRSFAVSRPAAAGGSTSGSAGGVPAWAWALATAALAGLGLVLARTRLREAR